MQVFAVVGGIAAGKSTVCALLAARHGAVVIDADRIGHRVLEAPRIRRQILRRFGRGLLDAEGRIDRRRLGRHVFGQDNHRQWLDALVHPEIGSRIRRRLRYRRSRGTRAVLVDAALYFEAPLRLQVDAVLGVTAPRGVRRKRLLARDALSVAQAEARLDSQPGVRRWLRRADVIVDTRGSRQDLPARVDAAWRDLQRIARRRR